MKKYITVYISGSLPSNACPKWVYPCYDICFQKDCTGLTHEMCDDTHNFRPSASAVCFHKVGSGSNPNEIWTVKSLCHAISSSGSDFGQIAFTEIHGY